MIFNLFLPFISFCILLGDFLKGGFFFSTTFLVISVLGLFYYSSIARMIGVEQSRIKESFIELPLTSLQRGMIYKLFMHTMIWPFIVATIGVLVVMGSYYLAILWGINLGLLIFSMYRLYYLKQQIIKEKQKGLDDE